MINRFALLPSSRQLPSVQIIRKAARAVFKMEKDRLSGDLNVIFVNNSVIKRLNRQFLKKNGNTDVIAFRYSAKSKKKPGISLSPFGDIFISFPVAKGNAKRLKEPIKRELIRLVIHGVLHLLGHRDDKIHQKNLMWRKQEEIVSSVLQPRK